MGTSGTNGCLQNFAGTALTGTCSSDARLKTNILPFAPVLDKLVKLQPVHFDWKVEQYPDYHFGAGRNSGLLAQDVETVFPEMVSADARGFKMVNYSELPYLTLAAIRELKIENDSLRAQLAALEERLARLEKPQSKGTKKNQPRTSEASGCRWRNLNPRLSGQQGGWGHSSSRAARVAQRCRILGPGRFELPSVTPSDSPNSICLSQGD